MYTTLTSPKAVEYPDPGRYGGTNYALHHKSISCEGLATQSIVRVNEDDELPNHEGMKRNTRRAFAFFITGTWG